MKRLCVFCGRWPARKNKEHVLPRWLLELTGNPGRTARFGIKYFTDEERRFAFDRFAFPACTACNERYSTLESATKRVVERIFKVQKIRADDVDVLLDWLDKVRIGLWLGIMSLNDNAFGIRPKFFINQRVARADRMVSLFVDDERSKGLTFTGPMYPSFMFQPSSFALRVNNLYVFNASCPFMVSKQAGFPFPVSAEEERDDGKTVMEFEEGTEEIVRPLLETRILRGSLTVYQPMFNESVEETFETYDTSFIRSHARNWEAGRGPLIADLKAGVRVLTDDDLTLSMLSNKLLYWEQLAVQVPRIQNHLSCLIPNRPTDAEAIQIWEKNREVNDLAIAKLKENLQASSLLRSQLTPFVQ